MSIVKKLSKILALSIVLGASSNVFAVTATGKVTNLWYSPVSGTIVSIVGNLGCITDSTVAGHVVSQLLVSKAHGRDVTVTCNTQGGVPTISSLQY